MLHACVRRFNMTGTMQFFFKTKQGRFEKKASTDYKVHGDHMKTRNLLHKPAGREREKKHTRHVFKSCAVTHIVADIR